MKFLRMTFTTVDEKTQKTGIITSNVFDGKAIIQFPNQEQTKFTYTSLIKSGKKAILSRGHIIQYFRGKSIMEIRDILKEDIKNGLKETDKSKRKITVQDYKEEER